MTIRALVRASTALLREVKPFIVTFVSCDGPAPASEAELEWFWTFLDVDRNCIGLFIAVYPFWDGRRVRVRAFVQQRDDWMAQVTTCIKYCFYWNYVSETRWAGVGPSSRKCLRSLFVGVEQSAKQAQASDAVMNWHLNGFNRATREVRQYLCVAAACARPSEAVVEELSDDNRFLMHSDR